jgi:hypothetical protein
MVTPEAGTNPHTARAKEIESLLLGCTENQTIKKTLWRHFRDGYDNIQRLEDSPMLATSLLPPGSDLYLPMPDLLTVELSSWIAITREKDPRQFSGLPETDLPPKTECAAPYYRTSLFDFPDLASAYHTTPLHDLFLLQCSLRMAYPPRPIFWPRGERSSQDWSSAEVVWAHFDEFFTAADLTEVPPDWNSVWVNEGNYPDDDVIKIMAFAMIDPNKRTPILHFSELIEYLGRDEVQACISRCPWIGQMEIRPAHFNRAFSRLLAQPYLEALITHNLLKPTDLPALYAYTANWLLESCLVMNHSEGEYRIKYEPYPAKTHENDLLPPPAALPYLVLAYKDYIEKSKDLGGPAGVAEERSARERAKKGLPALAEKVLSVSNAEPGSVFGLEIGTEKFLRYLRQMLRPVTKDQTPPTPEALLTTTQRWREIRKAGGRISQSAHDLQASHKVRVGNI